MRQVLDKEVVSISVMDILRSQCCSDSDARVSSFVSGVEGIHQKDSVNNLLKLRKHYQKIQRNIEQPRSSAKKKLMWSSAPPAVWFSTPREGYPSMESLKCARVVDLFYKYGVVVKIPAAACQPSQGKNAPKTEQQAQPHSKSSMDIHSTSVDYEKLRSRMKSAPTTLLEAVSSSQDGQRHVTSYVRTPLKPRHSARSRGPSARREGVASAKLPSTRPQVSPQQLQNKLNERLCPQPSSPPPCQSLDNAPFLPLVTSQVSRPNSAKSSALDDTLMPAPVTSVVFRKKGMVEFAPEVEIVPDSFVRFAEEDSVETIVSSSMEEIPHELNQKLPEEIEDQCSKCSNEGEEEDEVESSFEGTRDHAMQNSTHRHHKFLRHLALSNCRQTIYSSSN